MYTIEGDITIQYAPEALLGRFGVASTTKVFGLSEHSGIWVHDSEALAKRHAWLLRFLGQDRTAEAEAITTPEQADAYTGELSAKIEYELWQRPELSAKVDANIPERAKLLKANVRLWKELRVPTPVAYLGAYGRLQDAKTYTAEGGWHDQYDEIDSTRLRVGAMALRPIPRLEALIPLRDRSFKYDELNARLARWGFPQMPRPTDTAQ